MKRLKLEDFKSKNLKEEKIQEVEQLLGQVLGDCHDEPQNSSSREGGYNVGEIGPDSGF